MLIVLVIKFIQFFYIYIFIFIMKITFCDLKSIKKKSINKNSFCLNFAASERTSNVQITNYSYRL